MALKQFHLAACVVTSLVFIGGCGGDGSRPSTEPVSGSVKFKGAALAGATVTLVPATKPSQGEPFKTTTPRTAIAKTDASGEFKLTSVKQNDGAVPGDYKISVTKIEEPPPVTPSADIAAPPPKVVPIKSLIPERYNNPESSKLTATVKKGGPNRIDLDLKD